MAPKDENGDDLAQKDGNGDDLAQKDENGDDLAQKDENGDGLPKRTEIHFSHPQTHSFAQILLLFADVGKITLFWIFGKNQVRKIRGHLSRRLHNLRAWKPRHYQALTRAQKRKILRSKLFVKPKYLANGEFEKIKSRLVADGSQQDREEYDNRTSSPTVHTQSVFMVAGIGAQERRAVATIDFPGAYLHASMPDDAEPVLMQLSKEDSFILCKIDPTYKEFLREDGTLVVQLTKALYGCVESAKLWYEHLTVILENLGFSKNAQDGCVFNRTNADGSQTTIAVHVDDGLITAPSEREIDVLVDQLKDLFPDLNVYRGRVHSYLGMVMDFSVLGKCKITMDKYVEDLLRDCKVVGIATSPASEHLFEVRDLPMLSEADRQEFHTGVAKCLYLAKRTRPDILTPVAFLSTRVTQSAESDCR